MQTPLPSWQQPAPSCNHPCRHNGLRCRSSSGRACQVRLLKLKWAARMAARGLCHPAHCRHCALGGQQLVIMPKATRRPGRTTTTTKLRGSALFCLGYQQRLQPHRATANTARRLRYHSLRTRRCHWQAPPAATSSSKYAYAPSYPPPAAASNSAQCPSCRTTYDEAAAVAPSAAATMASQRSFSYSSGALKSGSQYDRHEKRWQVRHRDSHSQRRLPLRPRRAGWHGAFGCGAVCGGVGMLAGAPPAQRTCPLGGGCTEAWCPGARLHLQICALLPPSHICLPAAAPLVGCTAPRRRPHLHHVCVK